MHILLTFNTAEILPSVYISQPFTVNSVAEPEGIQAEIACSPFSPLLPEKLFKPVKMRSMRILEEQLKIEFCDP